MISPCSNRARVPIAIHRIVAIPQSVMDADSNKETNSIVMGKGFHLSMLGNINPNLRWYGSRPTVCS